MIKILFSVQKKMSISCKTLHKFFYLNVTDCNYRFVPKSNRKKENNAREIYKGCVQRFPENYNLQ